MAGWATSGLEGIVDGAVSGSLNPTCKARSVLFAGERFGVVGVFFAVKKEPQKKTQKNLEPRVNEEVGNGDAFGQLDFEQAREDVLTTPNERATKEEKEKLKIENGGASKAFLRKLFLQESITELNSRNILIAIDLFLILHFYSYIG